MADIEETIRDFLANDPDLGLNGTALDFDQSLISSGLIDSLAVLNIIEFLEARFDIQFDPEDLTGDNFDQISAMAVLVRARLGSGV